MAISAEEARDVLAQADRLYNNAAVEHAITGMARQLDRVLDGETTVALCVMTGAVVLAGKLLPQMQTPLLLDYVHATRYRGETSGGGIAWLKRQETPLGGRSVLVIDDILDEGYTLEAIVAHCHDAGATRVVSAVLTEKIHKRGCGFRADVVGLTVPDRYVFGYGMDYKGFLRNAAGIFAVAGEVA